jgi:hypothetical protein
MWIAGALAVTLLVGANVLRWLWHGLGVRAARWGYFRLALPLGLVFAALVGALQAAGLVKSPTLAELFSKIALETPARPSVAQASELIFQLKLYVDAMLVTLLKTVMSTEAAQVVGWFVSVNALTGLVVTVWAVVIAETAIQVERRFPSRS